MYAPSSPYPPRAFYLRAGLAFACVFTCLAGTALSGTPAHADATACKAIEDAMVANIKTPFHSFVTITFDYAAVVEEARRKLKLPASQSSETIFTGSAIYARLLPGKWRDLHTPPAQFEEHVRASFAGFKDCRRLANEKVDGAVVAVYEGDARPAQTKVWVSAQGIPVKSETDIEIGAAPGGDMIHQHLSTRYEYGDVHAPAMD